MLHIARACCVLLLWSGSSFGQQCSTPLYRVLKLSINNRRNHTGHWIAEVKLDPGAGQKEVDPWNVDIEHATTKCGEDESSEIKAVITAPSFTSRSSGTPPLGYSIVPGFGYYKLHTDLKTWDAALKSCEQEGAHLAIINSEAEALALSPFWDANPKIQEGGGNNWAHVGFHDKFIDHQYVTIFNESLSAIGYMKWFVGEPHQRSAEDCGVVYRRENLLGDIDCAAKMSYFCEWGFQ